MAKKEKDIPMPMQLGSVKKQPVGVRVVCGILKYLFLALIVVISIGPIIWAGLSSFKTYAEINTSAIALPKSFNFKITNTNPNAIWITPTALALP